MASVIQIQILLTSDEQGTELGRKDTEASDGALALQSARAKTEPWVYPL